MSGNYQVSAYSVINAFVWAGLQDEGILDPADYSLIPIMPAGGVPEFTELNPDQPFLVYTAGRSGTNENWFHEEESLAYVIYGKSQSEVHTIANYLIDVFRRYDDAAIDVNLWARANKQSLPASYNEFNFSEIHVVGAVGSEAPRQEGGRYNELVSLRYQYTTPLESNGRRKLTLS